MPGGRKPRGAGGDGGRDGGLGRLGGSGYHGGSGGGGATYPRHSASAMEGSGGRHGAGGTGGGRCATLLYGRVHSKMSARIEGMLALEVVRTVRCGRGLQAGCGRGRARLRVVGPGARVVY